MSEWNEAKRQANLAKHHLDFLRADELFDGRPIVTDEANSQIEPRLRTTGMIDGRLVTLIWMWRADVRRYISFRSARDEEKREYHQLYGGRN